MNAAVYERRRPLKYTPYLHIMHSRSAWLADAANFRRGLCNSPWMSVYVYNFLRSEFSLRICYYFRYSMVKTAHDGTVLGEVLLYVLFV